MRTLRVYGLAREARSFMAGRELYVADRDPDAAPELGQDDTLEPGILPHPGPVSPARMRQRQELGQVLAERAHGLGERPLAPALQVVLLRVSTDEECQLDAGQGGAESRLPGGRAAPRRRQVGAVHGSRVAQARGNDGDARAV